MITANIYCYLIKYRTKQKHLLPHCVKKNNFKKNTLLIWRVTKNGVIKAESNAELKEIGFKNRTRYYFDDIIEIDNLIML